MNEKKLAAETSIVSSWPTPFDVSIKCQDNILNGFIYGADIATLKGASECRVNSGKYDGRGLIQYKDGIVKYTINTPVGTSIGRVNAGSCSKAERLVQIRAASKMQKTQLMVIYK